MVATKRSSSHDVHLNPKHKGGAAAGGGSGIASERRESAAAVALIEPLGGFIFVCNNDTMSEDFERHLFGLPQRYQDTVRAIQPGLPLFLYNYSTRCLHGVFEASSDGGLNLEPGAWEIKDTRKNTRQSSRFPAQVRVRWREERPPLPEEKFRPLLYHYDGPKFRLELSKAEAEDLLKLFGTSDHHKMVEGEDDFGGEWEKVKSKSKVTRMNRPPRSTSPNSPAGRKRWGPVSNGSTNTAGAFLSSYSTTPMNGDALGHDRESRADIAQRWRSDSDSWSGSSSTGVSSSSWVSQDEDKPNKGIRENGGSLIVSHVTSGFREAHDEIVLKGEEQANRSCENGSERDSRADSEELNSELNAVRSSKGWDPQLDLQPPVHGGFMSYSAALKAGMSGSGTDMCNIERLSPSVGFDGGQIASTDGSAQSSRASSSTGGGPTPSNHGDMRGRRKCLKDDGGDSHSQQNFEALNLGVQGRQQQKEDAFFGGEVRRVGKGSAWKDSKLTLAARLVGTGTGSAPSGRLLGACQVIGKVGSVDSNTTVKEVGEDRPRNGLLEGEKGMDSHTMTKEIGKDGPPRNALLEGEKAMRGCGGNPQARKVVVGAVDKRSSPANFVSKTVAWQGNDAVGLRRLHEPVLVEDSTSSVNVGVSGQLPSPCIDTVKTMPVVVAKATPLQLQSPLADAAESEQNSQTQVSGEQQSPQPVDSLTEVTPPSAVLPSPQALQAKPHPQTPPFQPSLPVYELQKGQQNDQLKQEELVEEKVHVQNMQSQPPDQAPALMQSQQQRQLGQKLMPLRIPTPPPSLQQHHHHSPLSPAPSNSYYRDRTHARMRPGANYADTGPHLVAYRPVTRALPDGGTKLRNGYVQGGWGIPSPLPMSTPMSPIGDDGLFALPPPQLLANVEALHTEIVEFASMARPSPDARIRAETAVNCVREAVKQLWPSADVEVFGSFATGLCLPHSDVDVVVLDSPPPPDTPETTALLGARALAPLIRVLGTTLKEYEWCESLITIDSASMPVIKLRCRPSIASFEAATKSHNGTSAREYVIERLRQFPALAPLVLLLKSYLHQRGLNDVYTGGLGSFSLTLMLVFYLELLASMQSLPSPNLGLLLIGFLQSFGREIDFSHVRLVLKGRNGSSGGLFWPDKSSRPLALCIDDPLRPGANIGAGSFNMFHVQLAMQEMLQVLTRSLEVTSSERVGMGPGRRRPLPLLDQLFLTDNNLPTTQ
ncbi:unnamed protein product [Sphagnum jensenii]|uniref:DCD domain-containing protein n=1 Tax=Sphagnum jensenii TaxID=128206 RepID=A0ABP0WZ41_9BRYO